MMMIENLIILSVCRHLITYKLCSIYFRDRYERVTAANASTAWGSSITIVLGSRIASANETTDGSGFSCSLNSFCSVGASIFQRRLRMHCSTWTRLVVMFLLYSLRWTSYVPPKWLTEPKITSLSWLRPHLAWHIIEGRILNGLLSS